MDQFSSEQEQIDAIKGWLNRHGGPILNGLLLGMLILGGWRFWQNQLDARSYEAASSYELMRSYMNEKKYESAITEGKSILEHSTKTAYAGFAALMLAKIAHEQNDMGKVKTYLQWILKNSQDKTLQRIAGIRVARILLSEGNLQEASGIFEKISYAEKMQSYQTLKGDILAAQQKTEEAKHAYEEALAINGGSEQGTPLLQMKIDNLGNKIPSSTASPAK